MKSLIQAVAVAAILAAPVASFAQSADTTNQQPLTRAEVKQQLKQVEQAGYNPATANDVNYPADIQAAEKKVQQENPPVAQNSVADTSGYGPSTSGSSASGSMQQPQPTTPSQRVYFGH